ncbi:MAG: 4Fe-4S dicluster domain-containing protein [Planctomycetes bacterium]|nr:4Fe-4S dicluster domain-containing protein [Planctomycetota bacterium]
MEAAAQGNRPRRWLRALARAAALAAAVLLALPLLPWPWAAMLVPAASPYVAVGAALAARAASLATLVGLPLSVLALAVPRWFCRYGCPVGLLEEPLGRLRRSAATRFTRWPAVGQWLVLLTLGGAAAGYPLFLWLDPLAMLSALAGAWRHPPGWAAVAAGMGLPLVLIFSVLFPNAWCMRVCPLGAMQDLLTWPRRRLRRLAAAAEPSAGNTRQGLARRAILGAAAGAACGLATRAVRGASASPIRPPGAINEVRFTGLCIRCGNCAGACPSRIIRPDLGAGGLAGLLAPVVSFNENYCLEDCNRCQEVCPSGAIRRLSLDEKRRCVMGEARLDERLCLMTAGQECSICVRVCPYEAILAEPGADGFSLRPGIDLARCTGCGACQAACPTAPAKAIRVEAAPSKR